MSKTRLHATFAILSFGACRPAPIAPVEGPEPPAPQSFSSSSAPSPAASSAPPPVASSAPPPPSTPPATTPAPSATAKVPPAPCVPQKCEGTGMCDAYFEPGWLWTGASCLKFSASGCSLTGPDCGKLAADQATCVAAHAHCKGK